ERNHIPDFAGSQGHYPLCLLPCHDNDPGGSAQRAPLLIKGLWLAVDKVIHHNDIVLLIIIRPRGSVAGCDSHPRDECVVKNNTEEGKTPIARRSRNKAAKQNLAVRVEVFNQRAGPAVSLLLARPTPIRLVNICENRAEAADRCRSSPIGAGHEEQS